MLILKVVDFSWLELAPKIIFSYIAKLFVNYTTNFRTHEKSFTQNIQLSGLPVSKTLKSNTLLNMIIWISKIIVIRSDINDAYLNIGIPGSTNLTPTCELHVVSVAWDISKSFQSNCIVVPTGLWKIKNSFNNRQICYLLL